MKYIYHKQSIDLTYALCGQPIIGRAKDTHHINRKKEINCEKCKINNPIQ